LREPVKRLQQVLGYQFTNIGHLETALTHRSAGSRNNERFEFFGDSLLGFIIADKLFHHFSDADEGQLTRLRASLVKKETLAEIARELSLGKYLKLGQGELRSGGQSRASILADAVEAIIAAIYLDGGYREARQFVERLYLKRLEKLTPTKGLKDPKTRLQEFLQSRKMSTPEYVLIDASGPQHAQQFRVSCRVAEQQVEVTGTGGSKRKAEQDAASRVLQQLQEKLEHA
jgi:ribonuclease-3